MRLLYGVKEEVRSAYYVYIKFNPRLEKIKNVIIGKHLLGSLFDTVTVLEKKLPPY